MAKTLFYLFKETRPRQWIKNLIIFAPIFVTGKLLDPYLFQLTLVAFITLCAVTSGTYIINDISDLSKDKLHPFKKHRPLAAGKVSLRLATLTAILAFIVAGYLGSTISPAFLLVILSFVAVHILYSLYLKNIILLDILTIAGSFILRILAGEVATGYHISIWLFLTVVSAALFLAIGKRRSELTLISGWSGAIPASTRATLSHYSEKMLDVYISMFANSTWITYAFYAFLERPPILRRTFGSLLEANDLFFLQERKWLMLTIPFVIYGIMRYLQLIYEKNEGESPEKVLLSDKPLMVTAIILGLLLFAIIYVIRK